MAEITYKNYTYQLSELEHHYGKNVHIIACPVILTLLARLCRPETIQPEITHLVRDLYKDLLYKVIAGEFPQAEAKVRTRMFTATPSGVWQGNVLAHTTKAVTVGMARAGTLPSQVAFELLTHLLNPDGVRQDHIYMNRVANEAGEVVDIAVSGSKIGGDVANAIVLFPDPMGATGRSMAQAISIYKKMSQVLPLKFIAINLIATPEYLKYMATVHPDVIIYTARLDRGLSSDEILQTPLGKHWQQEQGLNERDYIVPGAGGVGEILNNAYV